MTACSKVVLCYTHYWLLRASINRLKALGWFISSSRLNFIRLLYDYFIDGVDEASCFAQQALRDKSPSHLIMFNGTEVTRHRRILETSIGKAWNAETSLLRLAALILKHNGHEEGNGAIDVSFWQLRLNKWLYNVNGHMRSELHCCNACKNVSCRGSHSSQIATL